jgi:5'-methylthioadenosine phosphorylase
MFRDRGADLINMSTVPEVIFARELGICYAKFAMATDYDSWHEAEKPVTWQMVLEVMKDNSENAKRLLTEAVSRIDFTDCGCCKT